MAPKPKPDNKEQSARFIEKAREIGADQQSDAAADTLMGRLAKEPPEPRKGGSSGEKSSR